MRVVVTERSAPWCVRRRVAFARAVTDGKVEVDGVRACLTGEQDLADWEWARRIAVLVEPSLPTELRPDLLVDARVLKQGHDTTLEDAPRVIGVGPGFRIGRDCHAAVETRRGPRLGRVLLRGETTPFTGIPGEIAGEASRRVLRAVAAGDFLATASIGSVVRAGDSVGRVGDHLVHARIGGVVRGLLADGTTVRAGQKVGDVDPRGDPQLCSTMSDKARAVGDGVLEAAQILLQRGNQGPI